MLASVSLSEQTLPALVPKKKKKKRRSECWYLRKSFSECCALRIGYKNVESCFFKAYFSTFHSVCVNKRHKQWCLFSANDQFIIHWQVRASEMQVLCKCSGVNETGFNCSTINSLHLLPFRASNSSFRTEAKTSTLKDSHRTRLASVSRRIKLCLQFVSAHRIYLETRMAGHNVSSASRTMYKEIQ